MNAFLRFYYRLIIVVVIVVIIKIFNVIQFFQFEVVIVVIETFLRLRVCFVCPLFKVARSNFAVCLPGRLHVNRKKLVFLILPFYGLKIRTFLKIQIKKIFFLRRLFPFLSAYIILLPHQVFDLW